MKPKVAIVRGKFLNRYEMQFFEPLVRDFDITAFGSLTSFHKKFAFPTVLLPSPMDVPDFYLKMPILNRLFVDAHYLLGLEDRLRGFDLIHTAETYFHYTQQCLNAKKRGYVKKVIATVLETIPHNNEGIWGRKGFKRRAREELDHIIALTQKAKQALILEGSDPSKITVIPHFIDTMRFSVSKHKTDKRDKKDLTILFCGRLEWEKGVFDILEVARRLITDRDLASYRLTFRFVGNGSQRSAMEALERKYGLTSFMQHDSAFYDDMPGEYRNADIFIAPSKPTATYEEQYCTVLLEAQASGLPIVTTRTGGIPENIGEAAILVEPGDIDALTKALKQFILDPKLRVIYSMKARKRAETVHDISYGANKMKSLYEKILHNP